MIQLVVAVVAYLSTFTIFSDAQFQPSALPLLVRSPYLSSWAYPNASTRDPQFWSGNRTLGWGGFIRVDGSVYEWMGSAFNDPGLKFNLTEGKDKAAANVDGITITPTRTIYSLSAGPMRFNFTFLSPIEPQDLTLQSFPFGYVYVDAASGDGNAHSVQVYSDLTGEWLSEDSGDTISWNTTISSSIVFHTAQRMPSDKPEAATYIAHDGMLYYASLTSSGMTWQTGGHYALRAWFLTQGRLNNTQDTNMRNISDNFPVFAFANDLGLISSTSQPVVWAIGYVHIPVIRYSPASEGLGLQPYWTTRYRAIDDGIQAFLEDFPDAKSRAESLDDKILSEAKQVSPNYANLVSLSARQTFGGVETAVSDYGEALMFMKDVGTSGRVSPVETIYASFPAFLYINTTWCRYLLEPLLQYQSQSSVYTRAYAAPDLGVNYPVAEGNSANVVRSIEDSGSMLIMAWAHARFSGDQGLLNTYYNTLKKWSDYLISTNVFAFSGYQDADGLTSANLTNLALKGIIGVRAMAEISYTLGRDVDAVKYQNQSATWAVQWEQSASFNGHLMSSYNSDTSWGMIYNLFADKLLGMNLVSQEIYNNQDRFYISLVVPGDKFGLPFDGSVSVAKSHWTMLAAATSNNASARDSLLRGVYEKAIDNTQFTPFPSTYSSQDGRVFSGQASPAQGAAFGLLSLNIDNKLANFPDASVGNKRSIGAQAGIGIGVASLIIIVLGFLLCWRQGKHTQAWYLWQKRFRRRSDVPGNGPELTDYRIEPYTTQKNQLQHQVNADHTRKRYESEPDLLGQTQEQADLGSTSRAEEDVATRAAHTRSGSLSSSARGHADDTHSLRNTVEHLRRTILELQSRVYGPPPSYRAGSPSSSPR
ncbi:hypothetical protein VNI00_007571 [Paramarasmius palmivorus]|uniref:DUF1793-domain-containing protein n=1 Tax=Paramarasmius palmivorus TaxID=297713 RepID=A0AAW0D3B1_9AGAR